MKKLLCVVLAALLVLSGVSVFAEEIMIDETFDYATTGLITGANTKIGDDKWESSSTMGSVRYGIVQNPWDSGNFLQLESAGSWAAYASAPAIKNTEFKMSTDKASLLTTNWRYADVMTSMGVKFMIHNGGLNWYMFVMSGVNATGWGADGAAGAYILKSVDGAISVLWSNRPGFSGMGLNQWHEVNVKYDGGIISYTVGGNIDPACASGLVIDPQPFDTDEGEVALVAMGADGYYAYFKNAKFSSFEPYMDKGQESEFVMYYDVASHLITDGVMDLKQPYVIRKLSNPALAGQTVNVAFSEDGETFTEDTQVTFNNEGEWINNITNKPQRYLKTDIFEGVSVFAQLIGGENVYVYSGESNKLEARVNGAKSSVSLAFDSTAATYAANAVTGVREATFDAKATAGIIEKNIKINVIGEMSKAIEAGTEADYVTSKKPVIDAVNKAIEDEDENAMLSVIMSTGENKLNSILDFNTEVLAGIEFTKIHRIGKGMLDYDKFDANSVDDVKVFIAAVENIIKVFELDNLEDTAKIEEVLINNNALYNVDLENAFYNEYKDEVLEAFKAKEFNSFKQIRNCFDNEYVMTAMEHASSYGRIQEIVEGEFDKIGCDEEKFDEIEDKTALYSAILEDKDDIKTITELKEYIDAYEPEEDDEDDSYTGGGGFGGGGGGGGGFTGGSAVIITTPSMSIDKGSDLYTEKEPVRESTYSDVAPDHWAFDDIAYLTSKNIINGFEGKFMPDNKVTCAEFVKMLTSAFAVPETENTENFADVEGSAWYAEFVLKAKNAGILEGDTDGNCNPSANLTRERAAVILARTLEKSGIALGKTASPKIFGDGQQISDWAFAHIAKLQTAGVIDGDGDGNFCPANTLSRSEAAKLISKSLRMSLETKTEVPAE